MDLDPVRLVLEALEREGVQYAVFGAVDLGIHGLAHSTEDLDLFLAPERENVERLKRALRSVLEDPSIDENSADDLLGEYPALQYVPPEGTLHLEQWDQANFAAHRKRLEEAAATGRDLVAALYAAEGKAEIVGGELITMSPAGDRHNRAGGNIYLSLRQYERTTRHGRAFTDMRGSSWTSEVGSRSPPTPPSISGPRPAPNS